jgi:hypothetical protein
MLSGQLTSPTQTTARIGAERKEVSLEAIFRIVRTIQKPVVGVTALSIPINLGSVGIDGGSRFLLCARAGARKVRR